MSHRRQVYLDHAASTPVDPRVIEAMLPYFNGVYGNAAASHWAGRAAERAIENARETIARVLNCPPNAIIFTSGGTESDNLAIRGAAWAAKARGRGAHLITTPVEHSAISNTVDQLAGEMGFSATILPVDGTGRVEPDDFAAAIQSDTAIASVMYANNEVGTINPISTLAAQARARGVLFHTDAVQTAGQLTLDVDALGVDMLSLSAHKFYAPKGVGLLYVRPGITLTPAQSGGSHEDGRRAGTSNTAGIVGMATALELAHAECEMRVAHYRAMRDALIDGILTRVAGAHLTGHHEQRLPAHASFVFEGVEANMLLMHLDIKGIAASSASACKTGNPEPSSVLLAMGYAPDLALSGLRLSVGMATTTDDVAYAVDVIAESVAKLKQVRASVSV
jgi:cysteine desulfurase